MPRPPKKREPHTHISDRKDDGRFHAYVVVGKKPNGETDRRHRMNLDRDALAQKVLDLEDLAEANAVPPVGTGSVKLKDWLETWYNEHAPKRSGYSTMGIRKWAIYNHLIPGLGEHHLDALETLAIEDFYFSSYNEGLAPKSIELIHETLDLALDKAVTLKLIRSNPSDDAERPEPEDEEFEIPDAEEITAILRVILGRPDRARWLTQMLGPRQGEALGVMASDFELDEQMINIRGKLQRRTYQHGCDDPASCAAPHCKKKPCKGVWKHGCANPRECARQHCNNSGLPIRARNCKPGCTAHAKACPKRREGKCHRHQRECPPPCPEGCTKHAMHCPQRTGGIVVVEPEHVGRKAIERPNKEAARPKRRNSRRNTRRTKRVKTKSRAGRRRFGIPDLFMPVFIEHFAELERRKAAAGNQWRGIGLAFCGPLGEPIDSRRDWGMWCDILEAADVEHMPLHWIRHIAATLLLAAGVDGRIVMDIMGWSDARMLKKYQHVADGLRRDAANRLGSLLSKGGGLVADSATSSATSAPFPTIIEAIEQGPESGELPALGAL